MVLLNRKISGRFLCYMQQVCVFADDGSMYSSEVEEGVKVESETGYLKAIRAYD